MAVDFELYWVIVNRTIFFHLGWREGGRRERGGRGGREGEGREGRRRMGGREGREAGCRERGREGGTCTCRRGVSIL